MIVIYCRGPDGDDDVGPAVPQRHGRHLNLRVSGTVSALPPRRAEEDAEGA